MILDKNGKIFGKINVVDLAVIIIVVAGIVGVFIRFTGGAGKIEGQASQIQYVVKVDGVRNYTVDAIKKMGKITDKKNSVVVGEIKDIKIAPSVHQSTTVTGEVVNAKLPDRYDCIITILSMGKETPSGYFNSNNEEISVGRGFDVSSKYVNTVGTIMSVESTK